VPVPPAHPAVLRGRRGARAVASGILNARPVAQCRPAPLAARRLRDALLPVDHRLLTWGVSLVAPKGAVFGGLSAVVLAGGDTFATPRDPVEVILPLGTRWRPGAEVRVRTTSVDDVVVDRYGLSRTGPVRTAVDLVRRGHLEDGVILLDRLVAAGLADLDAVRTAAAAPPLPHPRCRAVQGAREQGRR
jgi:hypothetical protein